MAARTSTPRDRSSDPAVRFVETAIAFVKAEEAYRARVRHPVYTGEGADHQKQVQELWWTKERHYAALKRLLKLPDEA